MLFTAIIQPLGFEKDFTIHSRVPPSAADSQQASSFRTNCLNIIRCLYDHSLDYNRYSTMGQRIRMSDRFWSLGTSANLG